MILPHKFRFDLRSDLERIAAGIDVRGRTTRLSHAYRNTRAANEALALREGGLQPGKLLMPHANSSLEYALRAALERKLGACGCRKATAPGRGWWCCAAGGDSD